MATSAAFEPPLHILSVLKYEDDAIARNLALPGQWDEFDEDIERATMMLSGDRLYRTFCLSFEKADILCNADPEQFALWPPTPLLDRYHPDESGFCAMDVKHVWLYFRDGIRLRDVEAVMRTIHTLGGTNVKINVQVLEDAAKFRLKAFGNSHFLSTSVTFWSFVPSSLYAKSSITAPSFNTALASRIEPSRLAACEAIFSAYELIEAILAQLVPFELASAADVCKAWRAIIRRLSILPSTAAVSPVSDLQREVHSWTLYPKDTILQLHPALLQQSEDPRACLLFLKFKPAICYHESKFEFRSTEQCDRLRPKPLARLFATIPPVSHLEFLCCKPMDATYPLAFSTESLCLGSGIRLSHFESFVRGLHLAGWETVTTEVDVLTPEYSRRGKLSSAVPEERVERTGDAMAQQGEERWTTVSWRSYRSRVQSSTSEYHKDTMAWRG